MRLTIDQYCRGLESGRMIIIDLQGHESGLQQVTIYDGEYNLVDVLDVTDSQFACLAMSVLE